MMAAAAASSLMPTHYARNTKTAHPKQGQPDFAVQAEHASGVVLDVKSTSVHGSGTDEGFDVPWHPHHGMEILELRGPWLASSG